MFTISSSDIIKKPSYITQPKEITFVEDTKKHIVNSVVIPYALYVQLKEKIEDELYLFQNKDALSQSYDDECIETQDNISSKSFEAIWDNKEDCIYDKYLKV
ncbi:MAG: hypothetical protein U9N33_03985 [Campylobacterota bacterium]|nr:hypothetical protein [Campylobacterota bacterium]